jgi:hypothetical protein
VAGYHRLPVATVGHAPRPNGTFPAVNLLPRHVNTSNQMRPYAVALLTHSIRPELNRALESLAQRT